jgi:hypothetical protein
MTSSPTVRRPAGGLFEGEGQVRLVIGVADADHDLALRCGRRARDDHDWAAGVRGKVPADRAQLAHTGARRPAGSHDEHGRAQAKAGQERGRFVDDQRCVDGQFRCGQPGAAGLLVQGVHRSLA